ncbi:Cation-transporting ATPase [Paragonimus heterotremus]|uniref:Cation-transporting ATPase n=1 Tax=Paragonimus heterotremus TaxID=100268 RepID=A0A8J4TJY5_9TREM|nr:Cation-transporting ATPase [Paragonimus heterotremus]
MSFLSLVCRFQMPNEIFKVRADQAQYAKVVPTPNNGSTAIVKIEHKKDPSTGTFKHFFFFQRLKYTFDNENKNSIYAVKFPIDWKVSDYLAWRGHDTMDKLSLAEENSGFNELHLNVPTFAELFKERATAPFFVFQVFCVGLWCLDEYWVYPILTLSMLCLFEAGLVQQQLRNLSEIRSMGAKPYNIHVYRQKRWTRIMSDKLVAGDIVSIADGNQRFLIPCDLLLVRGTCIVDESMLTGESVPVSKEPCEALRPDEQFTFDEGHKTHVLFGGTKVVQFNSPSKSSTHLKAPDNGCICFVLRTGLSTSQGRLLKTIMYSVKTVTANNLETFLFIAFLLIFAIVASAYVWIVGSADPRRNRYKLFLECTLIVTSVIPQELPIELSLAVNSSLLALSKLLVFCTEPFRIPFAGKVDICAFDKTGTLTEDTVVVEGVTGLNDYPANTLVPVHRCPLATVQVLASCHSLMHTTSGLVGDPMEQAMLSSTGWSLNNDNSVFGRTIPRSPPLRICQRFRFSSTLRRMSVIVSHQLPSGVEQTYLVCVKGSPEALLPMLIDAPPDYNESYLTMARRGARVLALGQKSLGLLSHQQVRDLTRDQVECDLNFCGFVLISCPLKPDSKDVLMQLCDSSHHVSMITGDNPLTACHVSTVLGLVRADSPVLVLTGPNALSEEWHWQSVDDSVVLPVLPSEEVCILPAVNKLTKTYDLCLTGEGIEALQSLCPRLLKILIPKAKIHARVVPKQKEDILVQLKQLGYVTLMCGDGTNDVGALKQAHVGVALLNEAERNVPAAPVNAGLTGIRSSSAGNVRGRVGDHNSLAARGDGKGPISTRLTSSLSAEAEQDVSVVRLGDASIAAPFTAKMPSPSGVCHIIKQGRCTLVTTLQMYKILAINALVCAYSFSVLFLKGFKTSDAQASIQAILLSASFLFISRSKPLKTLSKERPIPNIFNLYTLLTVTLQFLVHFSVLYTLTQEAEVRMPVKDVDFIDVHAEFEPSILNTVVYLISTGMQVSTIAVNYKGYPFMEPLTQNKPIVISLSVATGGVILLALGAFAEPLRLIHLDPQLRLIFFKALAFDFVGTWLIDRLLVLVFGRVQKKPL